MRSGVPGLLRQVLFNLLPNELRVTPQGGLVSLHARQLAAGWEWVVEDEGPGRPAAQGERIFDRFVRFERTDGEVQGSGNGLGLAICRSIVGLHRGSLPAENRPDRAGRRFVARLPSG